MGEKVAMISLGVIVGGGLAMTIGLALLCMIIWEKPQVAGEAHGWWLVPLGMAVGAFCGWKSEQSDDA